jgi:hypothetical protein
MMVIESYSSFECDNKKHGVAIGYSTSQWICNFCLTPLDFFIKQDLSAKHYIRYIDDMVIFERNKRKLHEAVRSIIYWLKAIGISIKNNWQVYRFDYIDTFGGRKGRDLDFLGLRFFRDKTILRKKRSLVIKRQAVKIRDKNFVTPRLARSFMSRIGWLKHFDSLSFYEIHIKPNVSIKKLKEVISYESRKQYKANIAL